jgi:hypothetical protein
MREDKRSEGFEEGEAAKEEACYSDEHRDQPFVEK